MTSQRPLVLRVGLIFGATAGLLTAAAGPAQATPWVTYSAGATIAAHVFGEKPGYHCQIAARHISGPWAAVNAAGEVVLDSGPVAGGRHVVRVICENRKRGDATTHLVGRGTEVFTA
ncbi:hypothetical protein [Nocardia pseudobrasiliensis]|uniref:Uncharacterized protein n=1 Tax=Nocardia pseudobrasiliensis TaxID=45979 RepID=A0A370I3Q5_9NOCA|nr:hypothetical protein [Nocardia pseudobrasiliensis]RDI64751.1 hypothetical protein DFR76_107126 [Nocardia pseudobrasiliensis]